MKILAKIVRTITIPPVLAAALITTLFVYNRALIGTYMQYFALLFFIALLPTLAYPLQPFIPPFKGKGREGQRNLAFIASVIGYVSGIIFAAITKAPMMVQILYWTYFISVMLLALFNRFTPWRASGHACGVLGPICSLIYFIGPVVLPAVFLFFLMIWASLKMKRHTLTELILGGMNSITALIIVIAVSSVFT